jgi:cell division protein FtsL
MTGRNYKGTKRRKGKSAIGKKTEILGIRIPLYLLPVLVVFGILTVYVTIEAATSGAKLAELERRAAELSEENQRLSGEIVRSSSLRDLGEKAEEMGFSKPSEVVYISEKEAVAKLP